MAVPVFSSAEKSRPPPHRMGQEREAVAMQEETPVCIRFAGEAEATTLEACWEALLRHWNPAGEEAAP